MLHAGFWACAALLGIMLVTRMTVTGIRVGDRLHVEIGAGAIGLTRTPPSVWRDSDELTSRDNDLGLFAVLPGWSSGQGGWSACVPLWMLMAAIGIPTFVLWRTRHAVVEQRPRCEPKPHCPACTYDLTGNTTGVCPECGRPASPTTTESNGG